MKFYYNGKLVRTSKSHHYTHALISATGKAITCSAKGPEACESFKQTRLNEMMENIVNAQTIIEAVKAGRPGVFLKNGRKEDYYKMSQLYTTDIAKLEESIQNYRESFDWYCQNWQVVPLTEIA